MARPAAKFPTEQELRILKIMWKSGPLTVREVREALAEQEDIELAHTTVVTTLHTMTDKGLLSREQEGKAYRFSARVSEDSVSQGMLGDLLERVFDGSAKALLLNLLDSEHVDAKEHAALKQLINRQRRGNKK